MASGYPDLMRGGEGFSGFVEDGLGFVGRFETSQSKPEFDREGNDLEGSIEKGMSLDRDDIDGIATATAIGMLASRSSSRIRNSSCAHPIMRRANSNAAGYRNERGFKRTLVLDSISRTESYALSSKFLVLNQGIASPARDDRSYPK